MLILIQIVIEKTKKERINEKKRISDYDNAKTAEEKKNIENKNNLERKESNRKIAEKNDNIEKYVEEYRQKLLHNMENK